MSVDQGIPTHVYVAAVLGSFGGVALIIGLLLWIELRDSDR